MSDWSLRLAKPDDARFLPKIERAAAELFASDPDCEDLDVDDVWDADELKVLISKGHCLVTESDGVIVGFLAAQPFGRELHIWEMDVHPDHGQRGIGTAMVRACLIDAQNTGFSAITLTTFRDLAWNGPFYSRMGFTEVTDLNVHPRLSEELAGEIAAGLPAHRRCAMIHSLG